MAKYSIPYKLSDREAILLVKKAVSSRFGILKDTGNVLKVGAPMMTATIKIGNGVVEINGKLAGGIVASTCNSAIMTEFQLAEK